MTTLKQYNDSMNFFYKFHLILDNRPEKVEIAFPVCGWYVGGLDIQGEIHINEKITKAIADIKEARGGGVMVGMEKEGGEYIINEELAETLTNIRNACEVIKEELSKEDVYFMNQDDVTLINIVKEELDLQDCEAERVVAFIKEMASEGYSITRDVLKNIEIQNNEGLDMVRLGDYEDYEFYVGTESEAEEYAMKYLMDSCQEYLGLGRGEWERVERYFDMDAWARDMMQDGLGNVISRYDGQKREQEVDGNEYLLFRTN